MNLPPTIHPQSMLSPSIIQLRRDHAREMAEIKETIALAKTLARRRNTEVAENVSSAPTETGAGRLEGEI